MTIGRYADALFFAFFFVIIFNKLLKYSFVVVEYRTTHLRSKPIGFFAFLGHKNCQLQQAVSSCL